MSVFNSKMVLQKYQIQPTPCYFEVKFVGMISLLSLIPG